MVQRYIWIFFILDLLFSGLDLSNEKIHDFYGFLFDTSFNAVSFGKIIKSFKHIDSLFDGGDLFKGKIDNILIHDIELFDAAFECVVFLVPVRCFDIKDLLFLVGLELVNQLDKSTFYLEQNSYNL